MEISHVQWQGGSAKRFKVRRRQITEYFGYVLTSQDLAMHVVTYIYTVRLHRYLIHTYFMVK